MAKKPSLFEILIVAGIVFFIVQALRTNITIEQEAVF